MCKPAQNVANQVITYSCFTAGILYYEKQSLIWRCLSPRKILNKLKIRVFHKVIHNVQKINIEVVTSIFTSIVKPINPQTCVFLIEDSLLSRFVHFRHVTRTKANSDAHALLFVKGLSRKLLE